MSAKAVIDTPTNQRELGWGWRLGWSNHPRDVAACKRIEAEGWAAVTRTAPRKPATAKRAAKVKPLALPVLLKRALGITPRPKP